jgi:hypothetical protein
MAGELTNTLTTFTCPSCGAEAAGQFCATCGERKLGTEDRSLRHYLDVVVDFLTHFDSKGYRSLWYLVTKPGFLSEEQLRGSRVRYAKPLSLFISINVAYFLSAALLDAHTFTTPLSVQLKMNDYYADFASRKVESRLHAESIPFEAFEAKYNEKAGVFSKTMIFLFIPIYAIIFHGLFLRRRRYFVEHAVIATHLWAFILLLLAVVVPLISVLLMWWSGAPSSAAVLSANDSLISIVLQIIIGVYLAAMLRRVYRAAYWYCAAVAAVIAWSFFQIVWLYRFFLFLIVLHTV